MSDEAKAIALRWGVKVLLVVAFAASIWWARTGADSHTGPAKPPRTESVAASGTYVSRFAERENMLAPQFRSMRVVHELLMISDLYASPGGQRLGDSGGYIDPGFMADPTIGAGKLPDVFMESPRAGYNFEFLGSDPTIRYQTEIYPDNVVRLRTDGNPPLLIDPPLTTN